MQQSSTDQMNESLREKVSRMLALADDATNEHEAAVALEKAQRILLEHNMTLHAFKSAGAPAEESGRVFEFDIDKGGPWRASLLGTIARASLCEVVQDGSGRAARHVYVFGTGSNVGAVVAMYDWIGEQIERLAHEAARARTREHRSYYGTAPRDTRSFKTSFYRSATVSIGKRLREARQSVEATDTTRALVVVAGQAALDRDRRFPRLTSVRRSATGNRDGMAAGRAAGAGMALNRPAALASRPALTAS